MKLFYSESNRNLDMEDFLRKCVEGLQQYANNPGAMLSAKEDIFGLPLGEDPVLSALTASGTLKVDVAKSVAAAVLGNTPVTQVP